MPDDRQFYGYRLRSEVALPGLPPLPPGGQADIVLRRGDVPTALAAPVWSSPFLQIGGDGTVLVRAGETLRFAIRGGREIILDAASGLAAGEIESFLLSAVAGALLHQRGDLVLHASCVAVAGRAVAIAGPSGRGKSTLAGALVAAGQTLVTDDICRVGFVDGQVFAMPGSLRLRLWPDAARELGRTPDSLAPGRPNHPKRLLVEPSGATAPVPLGAVIRLAVGPGGARIERLSGPASIMPAEDLLYRVRLGRGLGRGVGLFRDLMRLGGTVPVFRLTRGVGPHDLSPLVELVLSAMEREE